MKKTCLSLLGFMSLSLMFSQSNKVVSAWKYLKDYTDYKETASLTKAKDAIDLATVHVDTKDEAKTWVYRGKIYQTIFEQNLKNEAEKIKDVSDPGKKALLSYQNAGATELSEAFAAYTKAKELDVKKNYTEVIAKINECSRHIENKGIASYNSKDYAAALPLFEKAIEINSYLGRVDTTNFNNAAIVSEKGGNLEKAKFYCEKLIEIKAAKASTYGALANIYTQLKDSANSIATIKRGRAAFPSDEYLLRTEINQLLQSGQTAKAEDNLKLAIEKAPADYSLYVVLGNIYDNTANPKDAQGKELDKPKNYDELLKKAETNYSKAIELKPDYFDALYNLGVLYNNHGVAIAKSADSILDQTKYAKANAAANEQFAKAVPILEKALQINGTDKNTMFALKQLYARTQQTEKLKEINEKLKK